MTAHATLQIVMAWRYMTKAELEADNIVLISIIERNIESLQSSVKTLRAMLPSAGTFYLPVCESMAKAQDDIARSREFLDKLFSEGNYPQQQ